MKKDSHGIKYLISDQRPTAFEVSNKLLLIIISQEFLSRSSDTEFQTKR